MRNFLITLLLCALLMACSSTPQITSRDSAIRLSAHHIDLDDTYTIRNLLKQQHKEWQGVRHIDGGLDKDGIDCSGLVYRTYREKLGIDMPRTTQYQSEQGDAIDRNDLKAGDLVFFKTGLFTRHVGMYIDNGEFLHVSSSRGVMTSNLDQSYWRRTYWQARRIR